MRRVARLATLLVLTLPITGIGHAEEMNRNPPQSTPGEQLIRFRTSIDNLDAAVIRLLAERFKITRAVGALKAENDFPPVDPEREARQIARLRAIAAEAGLSPDFAEALHSFVVAEVVRNHKEIAAGRRR